MRLRHHYDGLKGGRPSNWAIGIGTGLLAVAALVAGSGYGDISSEKLDTELIGWVSAAVLLVAGLVSTSRLSHCLSHLVSRRSMPSAGGAVRILTSIVGYLFVTFGLLSLLAVPIEKLLVGAGLAGVVLGIAAQQSLGNVFAGLVLLSSRPFEVGDHIRVRSGALGGVFDVQVVELSLVYVTVRTADGPLRIPNSQMLAAGIGQLPPGAPLTAAPVAVPAAAAVPLPAAPAGPAPAAAPVVAAGVSAGVAVASATSTSDGPEAEATGALSAPASTATAALAGASSARPRRGRRPAK